jgi:TATA-box binding protein (TBP) (component of TFIID and TFIIIB)
LEDGILVEDHDKSYNKWRAFYLERERKRQKHAKSLHKNSSSTTTTTTATVIGLKIRELHDHVRGVELVAKVIEKGASRQFIGNDGHRTPRRLGEFLIADSTAAVYLTLLDSQLDFPGHIVGSKLTLCEAFVLPFKGLIRLLVSPYGSITAEEGSGFGEVNLDNNVSEPTEGSLDASYKGSALDGATEDEVRDWYQRAIALGRWVKGIHPASYARPFIIIQNVVTGASINQNIDLNSISTQLNVEYHPEQFPGLVYRLKKPHTATLIFSSGTMVCTGARSVSDAREAVSQVIAELESKGIRGSDEPQIEVQNIVASAGLGGAIDLENSLKLKVLSKPADHDMNHIREAAQMVFPERGAYFDCNLAGLHFMENRKALFYVFSNGRMVITGYLRDSTYQPYGIVTGCRSEASIYHSVVELKRLFETNGLIDYSDNE